MTGLEKMRELARSENHRMLRVCGRSNFGASNRNGDAGRIYVEQRRKSVAELYLAGLSVSSIADKTRFSRHTIVNDLTDMGLLK